MMALPPGSQPPCLDLVPSLDLLASDHSEDDGNGDEVVPEPTNAELLNAAGSSIKQQLFGKGFRGQLGPALFSL